MKETTSAVLIIGNEILSGRTKDENVKYIALKLSKIGIKLAEVKIIPDIKEEIISSVNGLRKKYSYVFTTGGIGPTHDDITSESISKAFKVKYEIHKDAYKILEDYYPPGKLNEGRIKMTKMPRGAKLIKNSITVAPGFYIDNVYVLAGVPKIMQAMFIDLIKNLKSGDPIINITITTDLYESILAKSLEQIQKDFNNCEIGSYPYFNFERKIGGVNIVVSGKDKSYLNTVEKKIITKINKLGGKVKQNNSL